VALRLRRCGLEALRLEAKQMWLEALRQFLMSSAQFLDEYRCNELRFQLLSTEVLRFFRHHAALVKLQIAFSHPLQIQTLRGCETELYK
jgi:hypothetical protein